MIGLVQVDGKMPNLALMQIASWWTREGETVEWYRGPLFAGEYDRIYASQLFNFSATPELPAHAELGGTGIDPRLLLPKGMREADPGLAWQLYPACDYHLGFTMKGCRFACKFCVVPVKEGRPRGNSDVEALLTNPRGADKLMLLDNDFFGGPRWQGNLQEIIDRRLRVCFAQGLNIRIITPEQAALLARCRFRNTSFDKRQVTFAWDRFRDAALIEKGIRICNEAGISGRQMQFFVLIGYDTTPAEDLERVEWLRERGCDPFVMAYDRTDEYQQDFQRWVNQRAAFNSTPWAEYSRTWRRGRWTHGEREPLPLEVGA